MNHSRTINSTYTFREVKGIVRSAASLIEHRDSKDIHVRLIDLLTGLSKLDNRDEVAVIILCGIYHIDFRDAEEILKRPRSTLNEWYISGLRKLTRILNGEF